MSQQENEVGNVHIVGEANVRTMADICDQVLSGYRKHDVIRIDVSAITDVDLTFIQLVEAARRSAVACGKRIELAAPAHTVLRHALERGGFLHDQECAEFWGCATESN